MCRVLGFICENNTRDRSSERDIRCRSICQHHWALYGPQRGATTRTARSCHGRVGSSPERRARDRETARRREEAPSRASPMSKPEDNRRENPNCSQREAQNARHRANCFRPIKATLQPGSRRRAGLSQDVAFHRKLSDHEPIISRIYARKSKSCTVRAWRTHALGCAVGVADGCFPTPRSPRFLLQGQARLLARHSRQEEQGGYYVCALRRRQVPFYLDPPGAQP